MGSYVQLYTLYNSVRPFGISAIVGGWDSEQELQVDGQVGSGPQSGAGGKQAGKVREGGPSLYMIEPSGLYWVCDGALIDRHGKLIDLRGTTAQQPGKADKQQRRS